jgi:hypothetical protein
MGHPAQTREPRKFLSTPQVIFVQLHELHRRSNRFLKNGLDARSAEAYFRQVGPANDNIYTF